MGNWPPREVKIDTGVCDFPTGSCAFQQKKLKNLGWTKKLATKRKIIKTIFEYSFFFLVMGLSFYTIFKGQDLKMIWAEIKTMSIPHLLLAMGLALGFTVTESLMIYFLLHSIDKNCRYKECFSYSFVGFFYSSITPSASGGQPMQLYYMAKDGRKVGTSFVILMIIATMNKIVLSLLGVGLLLFARPVIFPNLHGYKTLFYIGFTIDFVWTLILISLIAFTEPLRKLIIRIIAFVFKRRPLRAEKLFDHVNSFFASYQDSLSFIVTNAKRVIVVFFGCLVQRLCLLLIPLLIYHGLGMYETPSYVVILMQASICVTVEMLPLPGAQGITETMYRNVFSTLIPAANIMSCLYVTRGVNFYFPLIFALVIVIKRAVQSKRGK